ncbi:hypothetical protein HJ590_02615 [Naumannella sp. ID2617S]|uniref:Uncharacterized protein n=1 Tax=Enemella dayhoffiae TaxID=2016507 RepID=A0A255H1N1_9ACTN|nr:hypothetical protein [Enemella dayhoffiae]NNG18480.1 hypothetical protein [Naumannella sp. ID2617S]OYO21638.1 hypothetical protein CGZ93_10075 [Enemella dayhoffiae]
MVRLSRRWLIISAILALIGLYAVGSSIYWVVSMLGAPDTAWVAIPAVGAVLASVLVVIAVPLFKSWQPPRWVRIGLPIVAGGFGIVAAVGTFTLASLTACDYQCRPADTWKMLPAMLTAGVLTALGPGVWALTDRRDREDLLWPLAVAFVVIGIAVGIYQWVENGLY